MVEDDIDCDTPYSNIDSSHEMYVGFDDFRLFSPKNGRFDYFMKRVDTGLIKMSIFTHYTA
ncbi:MAG: hypothetical protein PVJ05_08175 [Candidatus Thorarchaeota archaeon]